MQAHLMPCLAALCLVSLCLPREQHCHSGGGQCLTLLNCALSAMRRMTLASLRCSSGPRDARKVLSLLPLALLLFSNWRRFIRCLHNPDRNFCRNLVHLHLHHPEL